MPRAGRLAPLLVLTLLGACGTRDDSTPGALSPAQEQELNDAAAMLDANAVDANAVSDGEGNSE